MFDAGYFDQTVDRRGTRCEKWDDRAVMAEGGVPLWVADMDFACAPAILDALRERAMHPCFGYNLEDAGDEEALISFWKRRHDLAIVPGETQMLPCVITGLKACVRAFTRPGDAVAILTPVYGPFYSAVSLNGRFVAPVSLIRGENGRYELNLNGLEDALKAGAKMIMMCSPHNPVSRLWSREELTGLACLAKRYGVPMVCDEIHADFVYAPGRFTSILSVPEARERTVMLCSASKTFNIAGLQQAAAVCPNKEMLEAFRKELTEAGVVSGNTFAMAAARAAYTACDDWLDGLISYLDGSRALVLDWLQACAPRVRVTPIEATYLAWLDVRPYGLDCARAAEKCFEAGVALTGGTFFGAEGEGFMRLNFACPRSQLREGIERLGRALERE